MTGRRCSNSIEQPYGFREGAIREEGADRSYARVREVSLPFFSFIPSAPRGSRIVCCSIPIDDVTTAQWYIGYDPDEPLAYNILTDFGATSGNHDHFNSDMGGWGEPVGAGPRRR